MKKIIISLSGAALAILLGFQAVNDRGPATATAAVSHMAPGVGAGDRIRADAAFMANGRKAANADAQGSGPAPLSSDAGTSTWAFLFMGVGAVGYSLRRRPNRKLAQAI